MPNAPPLGDEPLHWEYEMSYPMFEFVAADAGARDVDRVAVARLTPRGRDGLWN